MQQLNRGAHTTHSLNFHLIFCTKYRRTVLTTEVGDRVKEIILEIAKEQDAIVEAIETDTDVVFLSKLLYNLQLWTQRFAKFA